VGARGWAVDHDVYQSVGVMCHGSPGSGVALGA